MSDERIRKLMRSAEAYARKMGYHAFQDDFTSFVLERFVRKRKASLSQLFIDFVREEFGSTRTVEHNRLRKDVIEFQDFRAFYDHSPENRFILSEALTELDVVSRCIFLLTNLWGFSCEETGFCLNLPGHLVSRKNSKALKVLRLTLRREKERKDGSKSTSSSTSSPKSASTSSSSNRGSKGGLTTG